MLGAACFLIRDSRTSGRSLETRSPSLIPVTAPGFLFAFGEMRRARFFSSLARSFRELSAASLNLEPEMGDLQGRHPPGLSGAAPITTHP